MALRRRAAQACRACHAHRVKCDVTERAPCSRCRQKSIACEERESMRGKHRRVTPRTPQVIPAAGLSQAVREQTPLDDHISEGLEPGSPFSGSEPPIVAHEEDSELFLGESNALRYVQDAPVTDSRYHGRHRLTAQPSDQWTRAPAGCQDALEFPDRWLQESLLKAYFQWFHYSCPVVDEPEIWQRWQTNALPALLLQSLFLIGATHCDQSLLERLGGGSRQEVKYGFFSRAKTLYDDDFESSRFVVGQSLLLMSFWRGDPVSEKDPRHWIGAAIAVLQKMGFHRAGHAKGVRKRLWWAVYSRERQTAAALGLPNRIRDEDCDVENLRREDFTHAFTSTLAAGNVDVIVNFNLGMASIAMLLGDVVHARYLPGKRVDEAESRDLHEKLLQWRAKYLGTMPISVADGAACKNFHVNMLLMAYHNLRVLLFQSYQPELRNEENGGLCSSHVVDASTAICRIVEDMLSSKDICHCQIDVITNIFNTLCIQTLGLRHWTGERRTLAVYRAKVCLLGLRELQKTWDVTSWVLRLYFRYLDDGTAARLGMEGADKDLQPSDHLLLQNQEQQDQIPESFRDSRRTTQRQAGYGDTDVTPAMPFLMPFEPDTSLLAELGDGFVFNGSGTMNQEWHPDLFAEYM